jgi:TonB-linked SusC/RagA family outer membrane protein
MKKRCKFLVAITRPGCLNRASSDLKCRLLILLFFLLPFNGLLSLAALPQQGSITGTVRELAGETLVGVTVSIKGTSIGVTTDTDGKYTISDVPLRSVLVFRFIGMHTQEIVYTGQPVIDVVLEQEMIGLDELVVVGYGVQRKVTMTGSAAVVKNSDLVISPASSATQALAGKAPGIMTRMADGRPGNSAALQIRNMGTPLYVIDGTQSTEQAFNYIDMNDIEDITILKDASAAIYGIQAANGVVLVTTRKGKTGEKTKININSYQGWQEWTRFARAAGPGDFVFAQATADVNNTMAATGTGTTPWNAADIQKWRDGTEPGFIGTDWHDFAVVRNAPQSYLNVNATGGSENTSYYLSVSRLSQDGSFSEYNFNRTNIQSNIESQIGKNITIGARLSGQIRNTSSPAPPGDVMWNPLYGLYRNYPTWRPYANDNPNYPNHTGWDESQHALFKKSIIGYYDQVNRSFSPIIYAEYQTPIKGLKARAQYSFDINQGNYDRFQYTYNTYTYNAVTEKYDVTGGIATGSHARNSTLSLGNSYQGQLIYSGSFGPHSINATYVFEARDNVTPSNLSVSSIPSSNYLELIQYAEVTGFSNTWSASSMIGHVARLNYNFKSKYLFEVSGRYDASYKFPPGQRWGLFPSAALGWRISEESFFKSASFLEKVDNLKLRTSYGMLGNDSPGNYNAFDYLSGYSYNSGLQVFNNQLVVGTTLRNPGTTNITWAKAYLFNAGLDFTIARGFLSGEVDFFRRDVRGLSAQRYDVLIPDELSIVLPYENLNAQMQQGVDGLIRHSGTANSIRYSVSVNAGFSRAKVTEVYKPRFGNSWDEYRNASVGRYMGITWLYECIGQFQSMEEINNYPVNIDGRGNRTLLPGDLIYRDFNNDGLINALDMRPLGYNRAASDPWGWGVSRTGLPNLSYGLSASVSWKGFDLNVSAQGATQMTFIAEWELRNPLQGNANSSIRLLNDVWRQKDIFNPNDNDWIPGTYPSVRTNLASHSNGNRASTFWATNVTYLRLRNLDLGFNVPAKYLGILGIQSFRIYGNGFNLFSIDNLGKFNVDPEVSTTSGLQYPQSRVINVGANITF